MKATHLAIAASALALGTTLGVVGLNSISAEEATNYPPVIQNLAEKFNASPEDVKGVFEQTREERREEMQKQFEENLDQAVKDGKMTQEQKVTILSKRAAIEKEMEDVKNLKEDLHNWAEDNDIDLKELIPGKGKGLHRGFGR